MVLVESGIQLHHGAIFRHPHAEGDMRAAFAPLDEATGLIVRSPSLTPSYERVDLDLFSQRPDRYKIQSREVIERRKQRRSISPREAEEVAAAARFRLHIDQVQQELSPSLSKSPPEVEQCRVNTMLRQAVSADNVMGISKSRLIRVRDSQSVIRQKRSARSFPLQFDHDSSQTFSSAHNTILPARTSSRAASLFCYKNPTQRKNVSSHSQRTQEPAKFEQEMDASSGKVPPVPQHCSNQSPPESRASLPPISPRIHSRPSAPQASMGQVNQGISVEDYAQKQPLIWDGEQAVIPEQRRSRKLAQMLSSESKSEHLSADAVAAVMRNGPDPMQCHERQLQNIGCLSRKPVSRKKKTFFGWLHKKSEVDELIDMYMSDDCDKDFRSARDRFGRPKLAAFRPNRNMTDSSTLEAGDF